ncbi:S-adenosyl-L-methionine-dependent methyltransferase [Eremomyces bilateralis CBS 781.70]|uniref:DNA (cytosine-5-)-methyltransferase n=1 Tax=Eremomyces bilateralis CBS 781.70 TaxID=1392243 RepID=A0A6G1G3J8_9PEZI|nr:S-adenosyl-L-methionine-dependent methyltransferase [Eremomyces bilateralis CBS 781.70]KAF1812687.1 S-adenosyl-L-methionine-dependent methyltransferase [Eremomyces bilateralis CBS 781.70]
MMVQDYEERGTSDVGVDFDVAFGDDEDFDIDLSLILDHDDDRFDEDVREVPADNFYTVHENSLVQPPKELKPRRRLEEAKHQIPSAEWFDVNLHQGVIVEFWKDAITKADQLPEDKFGTRDERSGGDILLVTAVTMEPKKGGRFLRGLRLRRTRYFHTALLRYPNEVCLVAKISQDDPRPFWVQGEIEVPIDDDSIIQVRDMMFTDSEYPSLSVPQLYRRKTDVQNDPLICRYVWLHIFPTDTQRTKASEKPREGVVRKITQADWGNIRSRLQKETASHNQDGMDMVQMGRVEQTAQETIESQVAKLKVAQGTTKAYIFGDIFCGAGGASRAAKRAGLRIKYGIDNEVNACSAYKLNFSEAQVYHNDIQQILSERVDLRADIIHISFPCQYFSAAHTTLGVNDDMNSAVLLCLGDVLKKTQPRLVTFEEAPGLYNRHKLYFFFVLGAFQKHGYSVAYKVIKFMDYGLAQKRERLILFAAAPGVPLPRFPNPTRGWENEQKRPATLDDVLGGLSDWEMKPNDPLHEPRKTRKMDCLPFDRKLHRCLGCITTSGGLGNLHPCGKRTYTLREYARIQGFGDAHQFYGARRDMLRQIGNAVPPKCFKVFFDECIRTLTDVDDGKHGNVRCSPYESGSWTGLNAFDSAALPSNESFLRLGSRDFVRRDTRSSLFNRHRSRTLSPQPRFQDRRGDRVRRRSPDVGRYVGSSNRHDDAGRTADSSSRHNDVGGRAGNPRGHDDTRRRVVDLTLDDPERSPVADDELAGWEIVTAGF